MTSLQLARRHRNRAYRMCHWAMAARYQARVAALVIAWKHTNAEAYKLAKAPK